MSREPIARLRAADPLRGELPSALPHMPAPGGATAAPEGRARPRALAVASVVLLVTVLLHGFDHAFIQPRGIGGVSFEVMLGGIALTLTAALCVMAVIRRHRHARLMAGVAGPWVAALVVIGHFLPYWGEFSDPYADAGVGAISYAFAWAVVAAGVALAGVSALARR